MADENEKALDEIVDLFLNENQPVKLRLQALEMVKDLEGSDQGRKMLESKPKVYQAIAYIIEQNKFVLLIIAALKFFINSSTTLTSTNKSYQFFKTVMPKLDFLVDSVVKKDNLFADLISFLLSNISRNEDACDDLIAILIKEGRFEKIIDAYCDEKHNSQKRILHYLGLMISNLAARSTGREMLKTGPIFVRLTSFINHPMSVTRRRAAVQLVRNMCLDDTTHEWLFCYDSDLESINLSTNNTNPDGSLTELYNKDGDLLIKLLRPLCDGKDQIGDETMGDLSEDDIFNLPLDLQFLDESVTREQDPEMRQLLVESIWLLCSTKKGRATIKEAGVYKLINRLHQWEIGNSKREYNFTGEGDESSVAEAELKLIELLIGDEPEKEELQNFLKARIPDVRELEEGRLEDLD